MTSPLRIRLLGELTLASGDTPLPIGGSPRLLALLAYLLLHRAAPQARGQVAFLLWPDSAESQAYANLRSLLLLLRRTLPEAERFIQADRATLQWHPDASWSLDVDDFERALARATQATGAGDPAATRAALALAVECYRGDLLPGLYDEWLLPERERLRQSYLDALQQLARLAESMEDSDAAISANQRRLLADPLDEPAYGHLMRLHAARGETSAIRRVFHTCATVLQRELGVEPSTATHELYERLLRQETVQPSRHNLPLHFDSLVGREAELVLLRRLLADGGCRLLTLTGPGGIGKTRLAGRLAADMLDVFPGGAWFVPLARVTDAELVAPAIIQALDLQEPVSVSEAIGRPRPPVAALKAALGQREALLVLDNFEHVAAAAPLVAELLAAAPDIKVLATSRAPLHLAGERQFAVPPLALPTAESASLPQALLEQAAVRLFVERAQAVQPRFALTDGNAAAVAEICARLDGLPLAIELAAAWVKLLTPQALLARLDHRLALLDVGAGDLPTRHQTLRDTFDWSYSLLAAPEQALFAGLAVFGGSCTLSAIEQVLSKPTTENAKDASVLHLLYALVDKSLLQVQFETVAPLEESPRFTMLETIREYASERLAERADAEALHQRHALYYLDLAERAEPELLGPAQWTWMARLEEDYVNLTAALRWLLDRNRTVAPDAAERAMMGLRMIIALGRFWGVRAQSAEGHMWVETALAAVGLASLPAVPPLAVSSRLQARALAVAGRMNVVENSLPLARAQLEASVPIWRALGDLPSLADALTSLSLTRRSLGDEAGADEAVEEAVSCWLALGLPWATAKVLATRARQAIVRGDLASARALNTERLGIERADGTPQGYASVLLDLAHYALIEGDDVQAATLLRKSMDLWNSLAIAYWVACCLASWGWAFALQGLREPDTAAARGALLRAAELWGYVERFHPRPQPGPPLLIPSLISAPFDCAVAATRDALGATTFDAARAEGRALTEARAMALALEPASPI